MLLEILSSLVMGGLIGSLKLSEGKDAAKIQKICANCGLTVKEKKDVKTIQLLRRKNYEWGTEYAYRIPLGLSYADFVRKQDHLQDGLNNKKTILDITWKDVKNIKVNQSIPKQVKEIISKKMQIKKEIELEYDGTLKIRVYNQPMTEFYPYDESLLPKGWKIHVGVTRDRLITHDFEKIPHMVVAGTTRYGKTVFLKNAITTLIATQPKTVKFTLIDLKGGLAFQRFKNLSQVHSVAKNVVETLSSLQYIQKEMNQRMESFLAKGYEDVKESNLKERHFIIVDEAAQLASKGEADPKVKAVKIQCESIIAEIARVGGGLGYRIIYATQYPTSDTLPRQVKQNCDAKLCFKLQTDTASQVVLDESGAEKLPLIKGRAIYLTDRKTIVQTPMIENGYIEKAIAPYIVLKSRKDEHDVQRREASPERTNTVEFEAT